MALFNRDHFKFPPGHRTQLINFVKKVMLISQAGQKHKLENSTWICKTKAKKRRFSNVSGSVPCSEKTIAEVSKLVRCNASHCMGTKRD